jgi:hypothetical protein
MRIIEKSKKYEAWPGWFGVEKKRGLKTSKEKNVSETKNEYLERQKKNVKVWSDEIDKYHAKAEKLDAKGAERFKKHIAELKEKHSQLEKTLAELHKSGDEGWEELKSGSEKLFKTLDKSFKAAKEYFH